MTRAMIERVLLDGTAGKIECVINLPAGGEHRDRLHDAPRGRVHDAARDRLELGLPVITMILRPSRLIMERIFKSSSVSPLLETAKTTSPFIIIPSNMEHFSRLA